MRKLFSTDGLHVRDRFDYWHHVACRQFVMHDSRPKCREAFHATLAAAPLGNSELLQFHNADMDVWRTRKQTEHLAATDFFLCLQRRGALTLEQNGSTVTLRPGEMALIDPARPYSGNYSSQSDTLIFKSARAAMEARVGKAWSVAIRYLEPSTGVTSLLGSYLAGLPAQIDQVSAESASMLENHLLDLTAASVTDSMERTPKISSTRSLALLKLRTVVDSHLSDPTLTPDAIAGAAGLSIRYANALLADEGLSIMRLVLDRRLERCRAALSDPNQSHRTISEIAYGWGFSDMTHFSRRFKAAYGTAPSDYRQDRAQAG
jgi:AraC family transcriptional regulator, positive regulator of tynA and feaB